MCGDAPDTNTGLTATTNGDGFYLFDGLTSGSYAVRFPVDSMTGMGWKVSPQNVPGDDDGRTATPTRQTASPPAWTWA